MATQSQRSRKSASTNRRVRSQALPAFHQTLSGALEALWKRTDENGVCKGNGKQTIVMEALGLTSTQADHVNKCLAHLGLLNSNDKRGMGAAYTVGVQLVEVTPDMAAMAIEAVGPFPKAKTTASPPRSKARIVKPEPAVTPGSEPSTQPPVTDPDGPNNFDRLVDQTHRLKDSLARAMEEIRELQLQNGELTVQVEKLTGRLGHYEGGSSDVERLLAETEALLNQVN